MPQTVALLDLGSNSLRMMIVRVDADGSSRMVDQAKRMVRIGEGAFESRLLQPVPVERTIGALRDFAAACRTHGVDTVIALATSAVRDAANGLEVMERIRQETGFSFTVISGREEARLICLGVSSALEPLDGLRIFMDIGGGSTELAVARDADILELESLKLGAVRLAELFPERSSGPVSPEHYAQMKNHVRENGVLPLHRMKAHGAVELVGSSGTIQYLADVAAALALAKGEPVQEDRLALSGLLRAVEALCRCGEEERRAVPGMDARVTGILIPGAAILQTVMEELGFDSIRISRRGLRDGALADWLSRRASSAGEGSVREESVQRLATVCAFEERHSRHVAALALMFFDSSCEQGLVSLPADLRELLRLAALLHDIGIFLSYSRHNEHSAYLIRNSELLGFTRREIAFMASLALFHRGGYDAGHASLEELSVEQRQALRALSLFLSMAEALDKSHEQTVSSVRFVREGGGMALEIVSSQTCPVELERVRQSEAELAASLGVRRILWRIDEPRSVLEKSPA